MLGTKRVAAAFTLALMACGPALAETPDAVMARVRAHVEAKWSVSSKPEAEQRVGYTGRFTPKGGPSRSIRCDSGPVGEVSYTAFEGGGACAVYPYRKPDGAIWARVAVSAPDTAIADGEFHKDGGGQVDRAMNSLSLSPNPENQTPEDRAAEERSRAMAACQPADIEQAMRCLDLHWKPETRQEFAALPAKDVILSHFGADMWIRNNWGLWRGGALRDFFVARKVTHPDSMSSLILDAYWLRSHGCAVDWSDTSAISSRFERAVAGEACS